MRPGESGDELAGETQSARNLRRSAADLSDRSQAITLDLGDNLMKRSGISLCCAGVLAGACLASADTVAITEFLHNARGDDNGREFVELYNFGDTPVDLQSWILSDEDHNSYVIEGISIDAGDFLILVAGDSGMGGVAKKILFQEEWLGGATDDRVVGIDGNWTLSNSSDEILLRNERGTTVWNLAYGNDGREGEAVFLSLADYTVSDFGSKEAPGIVCEGFDNDSLDFLGYERNGSALAEDPNAYESAAANWGSPFFVVDDVPPTELGLVLSGECPGMVSMVVTNATPNGRIAILHAALPGSVDIPAGYPCEGTELGLNRTASPYALENADANGEFRLDMNLPARACGRWVQILDLSSCTTSNTAEL